MSWRTLGGRIAVSALTALLYAGLVAPLFLPPDPPPYCFPTNMYGEVCLHWQGHGGYEMPPPGIPADVVRFANEYERPAPSGLPQALSIVVGLATFAVLTLLARGPRVGPRRDR